MKKLLFTLTLLGLGLASGCHHPAASSRGSSRPPAPPTLSSFDSPDGTNAIQPHVMRFVEADIAHLFALYQELSGRSIIRSPAVPANIKINFENTTALTRVEALQALDNVFAAQNIVMVYLGARYVKAVPSAQAAQEPGPVVETPWRELPESSSYLIYIGKLKYLSAEQAIPILQPFAKLPNSIIGVKGSEVIVFRDYSANVRRMMQVLETVDKPGANFSSSPGKK